MGKLLLQSLHKLGPVEKGGGSVGGMRGNMFGFQQPRYYSTKSPMHTCDIKSSLFPMIAHRMPCLRSYTSKASRSSWLQLRPMGETLSMPLRNSMNVPRLSGSSMSEGEGGPSLR